MVKDGHLNATFGICKKMFLFIVSRKNPQDFSTEKPFF